jgi:hypothetical protein
MPQRATATRLQSALHGFVSCLHSNGVQTSKASRGLGLSGINTNTPQYRRAAMKCRQVLIGALRKVSSLTGPHR